MKYLTSKRLDIREESKIKYYIKEQEKLIDNQELLYPGKLDLLLARLKYTNNKYSKSGYR